MAGRGAAGRAAGRVLVLLLIAMVVTVTAMEAAPGTPTTQAALSTTAASTAPPTTPGAKTTARNERPATPRPAVAGDKPPEAVPVGMTDSPSTGSSPPSKPARLPADEQVTTETASVKPWMPSSPSPPPPTATPTTRSERGNGNDEPGTQSSGKPSGLSSAASLMLLAAETSTMLTKSPTPGTSPASTSAPPASMATLAEAKSTSLPPESVTPRLSPTAGPVSSSAPLTLVSSNESAKTPSNDVETATVTTTTSKPQTTVGLLNLAENFINGFAVMVLQSQVHVDEPGHVKEDKDANLLDDLVYKPEPLQFVTPNNTVVLAQRGTTAYLPCVIKNIADGLVTWLRRRDHHLLTVARGGYAQDERFQVVADQHPEDWTMQLKFVTDRDAGRYECQVSSHPPVSIYLHLKVVEARCVIEGPPEKFVRAGSQLRLSCHIDQCTTEPEFMFWYKDGIMVNFDQQKIYKVTVDLPNNSTVLVVERATRAHSGNYTCEAGQAKATSNYVHVISGENPAAMQTGGGGIAEQPLWITVLLLVPAIRTALG